MTDAELHQQLLYLSGLLDRLPTKLWWMKVDLDRLFGSGRVASLGGKVAHGYFWLLGRMWDRGGFIPANDRIIAQAMWIDVATWKHTYKPLIEPMLTRLPDASFQEIFTNKTLVMTMVEQAEKRLANKAKTDAATAARVAKSAAKSTPPADATKTVTSPLAADVKTTVTVPVTETVTVHPPAPALSKKGGPAARQVAGPGRPAPVEAGSLRPADLAETALPPSGAVASPGLEGRSLLAPTESPTPALLNSPIFRSNANGSATKPTPERGRASPDPEPLPEPQRAQPADKPAAGLFGAVEAARRRNEEEDR